MLILFLKTVDLVGLSFQGLFNVADSFIQSLILDNSLSDLFGFVLNRNHRLGNTLFELA